MTITTTDNLTTTAPEAIVAEPVEALDLVPVRWDSLAPGASLLVVAREDVERLGISRGDALEVRRCEQEVPGCLVTVETDADAGGLHLDAGSSLVGLPAGTDEALLFGVVEDAAEILDRVRARWADARSLVEQGRTLLRRRDEEVQGLRSTVDLWREDVRATGVRLAEYAEEQRHCDEWEREVRDHCAGLRVAGEILEETACRTRDFYVSVPVVVEVVVSVHARDEDEARDLADDDWTSWLTGDGDSILAERGSVDTSDRDSWDVEEGER